MGMPVDVNELSTTSTRQRMDTSSLNDRLLESKSSAQPEDRRAADESEPQSHGGIFMVGHRKIFGVSFLLGTTDALLGFVDDEGNGLLNSLYGLAVLLPSLAVGTRRLHDTGRSGWWQLLFLIPLVGLIVLLYWFALPGGTGDNQYGDDPKTAEQQEALE